MTPILQPCASDGSGPRTSSKPRLGNFLDMWNRSSREWISHRDMSQISACSLSKIDHGFDIGLCEISHYGLASGEWPPMGDQGDYMSSRDASGVRTPS